MKAKHIWAVYFSPTGGVKKVVTAIADDLSRNLKLEYTEIDFTIKENREKTYEFSETDIVVIGSCVYAGRIPNKIMPDFKQCFKGNQALAVPVVVFGNRSYDHALTELRMILEQADFRIVGAAAAVARHVFSDVLAKGRPDADDMNEIQAFAGEIAEKIAASDTPDILKLPEDEVVGPYYVPLQEDGTPAKFLKAKPLTDMDKCNLCGLCRKACPMGSIDETMQAVGVCIKCQACVKICPSHAKYFTDEQMLSHIRMLEKNYMRRAENCFLA